MAESVVGCLLNKLDAFTLEQWRLLREVHQGIDDVRHELQHMTAFLRVVDAKQDLDQQLQVWVNQVREVSYDSEDVLDEYFRRCSNRPEGILFRLLFSVKKLIFRRQIAADIQSLKSRVIKIRDSRQRYLLDNPQFQDQPSHLSCFPPNPPIIWHDPRRDALLRPEEDPVGMDKPKAELLQLLGDDIGGGGSGLKVVSIVGMGGLGKTTLATKVYNEVKPHFELCAKINVSQSFNVNELLKHLIHQLGLKLRDDEADLKLKEIVLDSLRPKRYLILLDDVWDLNAWNTLKVVFPDNPCCGSRILLTTRIHEVAATTGKGKFYEMSPLSSEDSWSLFCKKSFWGNPCPSPLETVSQRIVKRCRGLPLAIVAIGGVLGIRDTGNVDVWERIDRSMQAELDSNDTFQMVSNVLWMSYNDLPSYLKNCFLFLSAFPEDCLMKRTELIHLWVADGFVMKNQNLTCEEVAERYLNELVGRNLIQVAETSRHGRLTSVRMHDMLRDLALKESEKQEFLEFVDGKMVSAAWGKKIRRLSIRSNRIHDIEMDNRLSKLRAFIMWGTRDRLSRSAEYIEDVLSGRFSALSRVLDLGENCRWLRVLDLRGAPLKVFPNKIVELYHLKYLSLRETFVRAVPDSIGKLQNLEMLNLKGTHVRELPIGILKLHKLRHILVGPSRFGINSFLKAGSFTTDNSGFKALGGIGELQCLQKLCSIHLTGEANEQMISEIGRLTQLRKLCMTGIRGEEDAKALSSALNGLTDLHSLELTSEQFCEQAIDLDGLSSPPRYLQRLYLRGSLASPQWISILQNLVLLSLSGTKLKDDALESLKALPTLRVLILCWAYEGETLCFKAGGFPSLKDLELFALRGLKRMEIEEGSLPSLEELSIYDCTSLKEAAGVQYLARLKRIGLGQPSYDLFTQVKEKKCPSVELYGSVDERRRYLGEAEGWPAGTGYKRFKA